MAKSDPRRVTREEHDLIQKRANLQGEEDYAVTVQKGKGYWVKTTHVFNRRPMLKEINEYEQTAGKVKFKGQNAELQGSQINAAFTLYNTLINRTYDVLVGVRVIDGPLDRVASQKQVDPLIKREAIRELIGEVYSATRMEESLGGDAEGQKEESSPDEDPEDHTSDA